jgi:anti-sigma regulatory factor (Ser/Thr protein kinase)
MASTLVHNGKRRYYWRIPSEPALIHDVWGEMKQFILGEVNEGRHFGIELVVRELLMNAMKHGNAGNSGRYVDLVVKLWSGYLLVEVKDEGAGFDWKQAYEKYVADQDTSGRGLSIVLIYTQAIRHNHCGNLVKAWFTNVNRE